METIVARSGFCRGIEQAYARMNRIAGGRGGLKALRPPITDRSQIAWDPLQRIHDRDRVLLRQYPHLAGVTVMDDLHGIIAEDVVASGHHGLTPAQVKGIRSRGAEAHDFRCPMTGLFDDAAASLIAKGNNLIIFGKPRNPHCMRARLTAEIRGYIGIITENIEELLGGIPLAGRRWACLAQVTANAENWDRFVAGLPETGVDIRIADTLCRDSRSRQQEAAEVADRADTVLVIDDRGGSTVSVYERCRSMNPNTFRYDPHENRPPEIPGGTASVGLVGGIHVPAWELERLAAGIAEVSTGNIRSRVA